MPELQRFDHLSPEERAVVGEPEDYDWEHPIEPEAAVRPHGRSQFSMRIDPVLHSELMVAAQTKGVSFSEVVREALEGFVGRGGVAQGPAMISFSNANVITSGTIRLGTPTRGPSAVITGASAEPESVTGVAAGI